ncbi:MAG: outer membrane beta-barrel protein, partial [Campylobacterota bacterium]|nr:outer membrane beta-barrel protein [Campylobacterota bacterium]
EIKLTKLIKLSLLTSLTLLTQANAESFEVNNIFTETREGWMGSIGLGFHSTSFDSDNFLTIDAESGFASSIKLGYNFTEQFGLYYIRNASWYSVPSTNDLHVSGIAGLGATYYFTPNLNTWYASIGVGVGDFANIDEKLSETGSAFLATVGYEFSPHWQAEVSLLSTNIDDDSSNLETTSVQFLLNYSWY